MDEFEGRYYQKYGARGSRFVLQGVGGKMPSEEQARRVKLNFDPFVYDVDLSRCVMKGFESFERAGRAQSAESIGSTFEPLFPLLATLWDASFEVLPATLKPRVRQYFPLIGWDVGNPSWRQKSVAEKDFEHDPSMASERVRLLTISSRIADIKRELREWELSSVPTAMDRQVRDDKIRALRSELVEKRGAVSAPVLAAGLLVQDPPDFPLSPTETRSPVRAAPRPGTMDQLPILLPAGTEIVPVPDVPTLIAVAKYKRMLETGLLPGGVGEMPEDEMARLRNVQIYKLEREHSLELMQALSLGIQGKSGGLPAYSN